MKVNVCLLLFLLTTTGYPKTDFLYIGIYWSSIFVYIDIGQLIVKYTSFYGTLCMQNDFF